MWLGSVTLLAFIVSFTTGKTVDLSGRGLRKEDFFVKVQPNFNLQEVTDLILRDNEFDSFLDCSTNLASLRTLDLSRNHLQRFFFLCKDEYNLQVLNVSHNKLEYLDDTAINDRIFKLKILDLSWNKLSIVNETMLEHLKVLEYLSLANNPISNGIHENAFWNLKALKHLDLRNVSAPYFSPDYFKTLTNLSTLDLSWNPIKVISWLPPSLKELDLSGTQLTRLQEFYLPQLVELRLNNMQSMKLLFFNDLVNLTSLETLSIVGSKSLVHLTLLQHNGPLLPRLQRLSINDCALQTLGPDLRPILQRTLLMNLQNNPWNCDCQLRWLNAMNVTRELSREIKCRAPDRHKDKLLSEVPSYELQCEYVSSIFYPTLWSCIAILVIAILLIAVFFLRRPFGHWNVRRRNRDTVTYTNVVESSNDLVRILAISETTEQNEE